MFHGNVTGMVAMGGRTRSDEFHMFGSLADWKSCS
jgi:hypothetical protein